MNKNRPSCYAPWITTYEWPDGNITPCCEWHSPLLTIKTDEHMSFEERFNHPITQKIKDKLLKSSKLPSGCKNCNALEQANQKSLRQQLEERVDLTLIGSLIKINLTYFIWITEKVIYAILVV